ncbi:MAG: hypothetical protein K6G78_00225 [bacterium]|nr:hypothetical protein [bacterium]
MANAPSRNQLICLSCSETFELDELEVKGGIGYCPRCGAQLLERDYDAAANAIFEKVAQTKDTVGQLEEEISELNAQIDSLGKLKALKRRSLSKQVLAKEMEIDELNESIGPTRKPLGSIARSRYLSGSWNVGAQIGLRTDGEEQDEGHSLEPRYASDGTFELIPSAYPSPTPTDKHIIERFDVFEILRKAIDGGDLRMAGARIVPLANLRLPSTEDRFDPSADMVILAPSSAFVIDVRGWSEHVEIMNDALSKASEGEGPADDGEPEMDDPRPSKRSLEYHAALSDYGANIFDVIVFVNPRSFISSGSSFHSNYFAGWFRNGNTNITEVIAKKCAALPAAFSDDELEQRFDSMSAKLIDIARRLG